MLKRNGLILLSAMLLVSLIGCGTQESVPATTVEKYFSALVEKDDALLVSYLCPEFEFEALVEFDAFAIVETSLVDLHCEEVGGGEGQADVTCQGSIEATYGNEVRNFDVSRRVYHLVEENGSWLVCGYDDIN